MGSRIQSVLCVVKASINSFNSSELDSTYFKYCVGFIWSAMKRFLSLESISPFFSCNIFIPEIFLNKLEYASNSFAVKGSILNIFKKASFIKRLPSLICQLGSLL